MTPNDSSNPLTREQKRALKRRIIQSGKSAAGMSDAELVDAARALGADDVPGEAPRHDDDPAGTGGKSPGTPDDYEPGEAFGPASPMDGAEGAEGGAEGAQGAEGGAEGEPGQGDADGDAEGEQGDGDAEGDAEGQDADDDGDADAPTDTGEQGDGEGESPEGETPEQREQRQSGQREQRGQDDDPIRAMMREIANVEIDGREYPDEIRRVRGALAREIQRRRKLARRTARAVKRLDRMVRQGGAPAPATDSNPAKRVDVRVERADRPAVEIEGAHPQLPDLINVLQAGIHPLLVGPAGSGKSTLAEQAAKALDLEFFSTGAVHQKYELTGYMDAKGDYVTTQLYRVATEGGVFLWDEIDASMPQPLVAFNQLLANGIMYFPNGEKVELHKDAYFIAAANTVGTGANRTYVGRNPLDGATLDRYFQITVEYDDNLETRLAHEHYLAAGGSPEQSRKVDDWLAEVRKVRAFVDNNQWGIIISPRASIYGAKLIARGAALKFIREGTIFRHLSDDQRRQLKSAT